MYDILLVYVVQDVAELDAETEELYEWEAVAVG